jgi:hypothetical protein
LEWCGDVWGGVGGIELVRRKTKDNAETRRAQR